jgi:transcriptional regulator with XRE-family HTH domain
MDMTLRPPDVAPAVADIPEAGMSGGLDGAQLPQVDLETLAGNRGPTNGSAAHADITAPAERRPAHDVEGAARHTGVKVLERTVTTDTADDTVEAGAETDVDAAEPATTPEIAERIARVAKALTEGAAEWGAAFPPEMAQRAGRIFVESPDTVEMRQQRAARNRATWTPRPAEAAESGDNGAPAADDNPPPTEPPEQLPVPADNGGEGNNGGNGDDANAADIADTPMGKPEVVPPVNESLSSLCSERGLTRSDLAARAGVPPEEIDGLLDGTTRPDIVEVLIPVMQAMDVPTYQGLGLIDRYRGEIDPSQLPTPGVPDGADTSDLVGWPSGAVRPDENPVNNSATGANVNGKAEVVGAKTQPDSQPAPAGGVSEAFNIAQRVSGITVPELAARTGADPSTLTRFLNGTHHPDRQFVEVLGRELGMSPERIRSELEHYRAA